MSTDSTPEMPLRALVDVALEDGARGVAFDDDGLTVEAEGDPVEDAVVGEAGELLLDLLGDAQGVLLRPGGAGGGVLGEDGWEQRG